MQCLLDVPPELMHLSSLEVQLPKVLAQVLRDPAGVLKMPVKKLQNPLAASRPVSADAIWRVL
eukprot:13473795-Alexandrium_andersonii.AAC.1